MLLANRVLGDGVFMCIGLGMGALWMAIDLLPPEPHMTMRRTSIIDSNEYSAKMSTF